MRRIVAVVITCLLFASCAQTSHEARRADLGVRPDWQVVVSSLETPGPIEFERIVAADWAVDRSGLINLEAKAAREAGLEDGLEPIKIYMFAIRHPEHGLFLIDTGVDHATATGNTDAMAASWLVRGELNLERLEVHVDTKTWLEQQDEPLAGVFLTHLHIDHAMGVPDIPDEVPIYTGPGEREDTKFVNLFLQGTIGRILEGKGPLRELQAASIEGSQFDGVVDVFGDQTLIALHVPGHTTGTLAFVVRTVDGPVLVVGDASHTAWGWDHRVEPGTFSSDTERSAASLLKLIEFAERHPEMAVHLGHQPHPRNER